MPRWAGRRAGRAYNRDEDRDSGWTFRPVDGKLLSLRWGAGARDQRDRTARRHADILREQLDGVTGR